jgi:hypothetical protein
LALSTIHWRLLLRVKNRIKADRKIEEVRRLFARDIEVTVSERYWKDEALWDCGLNTPVGSGDAAEVAFDCLVLANRLGNGWYIRGPGGAGEMVVFAGVFDAHQTGTAYLAGLEWASFSV